MEPVRWGVMSTAKIGINAVVPAIARSDEAEVLAIASRDEDRAIQTAAEHGIARAHAGYQALLDDEDVEAVYIPLPNHLHREWVKRAADAGKHVLCEKPLAIDAVEAADMVEHCAGAGVVLSEAFMYRYHPMWALFRDLVSSGRLGSPVALSGWFSYYANDPLNIRARPEWGGGGLLDIGCYPINAMRMLMGREPERAYGSLVVDPEWDVDVVATGTLDFGDALGMFTATMRAHQAQRFAVYGTEARAWTDVAWNPNPDQVIDVYIASGNIYRPDVETRSVGPADQYQLQVEAVGQTIRGRNPLPYPTEDAIGNMAVIDSIFASAGRTGRGEGS